MEGYQENKMISKREHVVIPGRERCDE